MHTCACKRKRSFVFFTPVIKAIGDPSPMVEQLLTSVTNHRCKTHYTRGETEADRDRYKGRERQTDRQTDRQRKRQKQRDRDRETERDRGRDRETETERERERERGQQDNGWG